MLEPLPDFDSSSFCESFTDFLSLIVEVILLYDEIDFVTITELRFPANGTCLFTVDIDLLSTELEFTLGPVLNFFSEIAAPALFLPLLATEFTPLAADGYLLDKPGLFASDMVPLALSGSRLF